MHPVMQDKKMFLIVSTILTYGENIHEIMIKFTARVSEKNQKSYKKHTSYTILYREQKLKINIKFDNYFLI